MSYLVDTNALSELRRKNPDPSVVEWFAHRPAASLYLSVLTLGELRKGVEKVADPARRLLLQDWLEQALPTYFAGRILPVDASVADRWGRLQANMGRPLPVIDSLIAATAQRHDLTLVTRNEKDFAGFDLELINPWRRA